MLRNLLLLLPITRSSNANISNIVRMERRVVLEVEKVEAREIKARRAAKVAEVLRRVEMERLEAKRRILAPMG